MHHLHNVVQTPNFKSFSLTSNIFEGYPDNGFPPSNHVNFCPDSGSTSRPLHFHQPAFWLKPTHMVSKAEEAKLRDPKLTQPTPWSYWNQNPFTYKALVCVSEGERGGYRQTSRRGGGRGDGGDIALPSQNDISPLPSRKIVTSEF